MRKPLLLLIFLIGILSSCAEKGKSPKVRMVAAARTGDNSAAGNTKTILLLPLGDFPKSDASLLLRRLRAVCGNVRLLPAEPMPRSAWYGPRKRYRADSLIQWMARQAGSGEVFLGITAQDISTTKNGYADWGVMGLGLQPGKACLASFHRLHARNRQDEFFKVAIHELGHTAGLLHCPERTCFMRDAEGGNPTGEEREFCKNCREKLVAEGWWL
ncbi:MAG: Zn-dependent protease [Chitinophagaceae bacterium]|nr:MAG: Zn-dependent protease [Chitinophagaceae bacterium]